MVVRFEDAGWEADAVMGALEAMREGDIDWRNGRAPLYVFSATDAVTEIGKAAFNAYFSENALGARRAFPSLLRMEQEVVGMGLDLFHAPVGAAGNMTSGGTESIVMAVKACRDWARAERGWLPGQVTTPPSLHLMLSLQHSGARERYLGDLTDSVAVVRAERGARVATPARYV